MIPKKTNVLRSRLITHTKNDGLVEEQNLGERGCCPVSAGFMWFGGDPIFDGAAGQFL